MNHELEPLLGSLIITTLVVVGVWVGSSIYRRYTGLTRVQSAVLWLLAIGVSVGCIINLWEHRQWHGDAELWHGGAESTPVQLASLILLPLLAAPFVVRSYRKWIRGHLTDAEKLPGMDGVRAWLTPGNLFCAMLIPICTWQAFQFPLPAMFALTFGLLLAYPVFNMASAAPQTAPTAPVEDLSGEREKVLRLLEAGKINAEESAELLNALSQTIPPRPPAASEMELSPARKLVLVGAALLLVGFFLPWFRVNLGQVMNEAAGQVQQMMGGLMPGNGMPQLNLPQSNGLVQVVQAGNIPHGLGWWILALGIGAAVLPFFATNLKAQLQKKVILAALAVGAFLLVYLLSDALRYVSIGVVLALAGYALEFVGTLKEPAAAR